MVDHPQPGPGHPHAPIIAPPAGTPASDSDVHLLDRLSILLKYRRIVLTVFLLVVMAMTIQTYATVPLYRAQARLPIDEEQSPTAEIRDAAPAYRDQQSYFQTQHRIIRGRELARSLVARLDLAGNPEFNGQAPQRTGLLLAAASVRDRLTQLFRQAPADAPAAVRSGVAVDDRALVDAFLSRVEVIPIRNSKLVDVQFVSTSPEFAARATNALAEAYIDQNLASRLQDTDQTLSWLTEELVRQKAKVEESERALARYREQQNALSLDGRQDIVVARLSQLNQELTRARTERLQKQSLHNQVRAIRDGEASPSTFPSSLQTPQIVAQNGAIAELQREKTRLSERYGEKHPEMIRVTRELAEAQRVLQQEAAKVVEAVANEYKTAVATESMLAGALEDQKRAALDLDRKSVDYTVLERDAQSNRQVYEALLAREKELRVASNSRANNVRLIDRAEVPGEPFAPDVPRNLFIAVVLGLALGVIAALGIDYLDDTIKTPEDITRKLRLPFLGLVPAVRGDRVPLLSEAVPHEFGEAFRSLRTSLVFSSAAAATRIVAVTSAQPLEGKTTTACNLAQALAFGGARVLLIDADMRRPGLHKLLGRPNDVGLSHLLVGRARARDAIQPTADPNLWVVLAGRTPPNPSELLASPRMQSLVANLADGPFDWVIIDTPPVLAVTDAVIITPLVSGVVFVLGAEMTRRRLAERAVQTMMASNPRVLGCVLNRVDYDRNKYYYSRFYGYQYKSYYGRASTAA